LTQQQLDEVTAIIDGDSRVTSITGPHPTEGDVAPWSQDKPNRFVGAVASVAIAGAPSTIAADVPSWECIDGRFQGGIFHTEATNVSRLMVWVDLQQHQVVAIIPDPLSGAHVTGPPDRIGDAYFPEGDCQTSD
jgi:hypothetical protein